MWSLPLVRFQNNAHVLLKLQHIYKNSWYKDINRIGTSGNGNKLRVYNKFKDTFQLEKYLMAIKNKSSRANICNLRISSHKLEVEQGRYKRPKVDYDDRICRFCKTHVENEYHFLLQCGLYHEVRQNFLKLLLQIMPNFLSLSDKDKFLLLISCSDNELIFMLSKYIDKCVQMRNDSLPSS